MRVSGNYTLPGVGNGCVTGVTHALLAIERPPCLRALKAAWDLRQCAVRIGLHETRTLRAQHCRRNPPVRRQLFARRGHRGERPGKRDGGGLHPGRTTELRRIWRRHADRPRVRQAGGIGLGGRRGGQLRRLRLLLRCSTGSAGRRSLHAGSLNRWQVRWSAYCREAIRFTGDWRPGRCGTSDRPLQGRRLRVRPSTEQRRACVGHRSRPVSIG